jgi:PEP-CTERM motif
MVSQNYAGDAYSNTPLVTNFSALQGLNAADAFTVDLNGMVVSPNATPDANNIYFFIYNASTNAQVFSDAGPPTVTDFVIPGGTLAAGTSYYYNLVYDDRIVGTTSGDSPITLTQFYDIGTAGDFSTAAGAVPEPSTWAMLIIGFAGVGFMIRRRAGLSAKAA